MTLQQVINDALVKAGFEKNEYVRYGDNTSCDREYMARTYSPKYKEKAAKSRFRLPL
jgi:hypothetical protein